VELGYVLRRAWHITWAHRRLWVFGALVSLALIGARLGVSGSQWGLAAQELPPEVQQPIITFLENSRSATATVIWTVVGIVVGVGLTLLGSLGCVGLVHQTRAAEAYGIVVLKGGWLAAKRHLWQVFVIRLLLGLPVGVVALLGLLPGIVARLYVLNHAQSEATLLGELAAGLLRVTCFAPAACVSAALAIPIGVMQRLAVRACVLEKLAVRAGIARAWEVLREHLGRLALMWLALLCIGIAAALVILLPLALLGTLLWAAARLTVVYSSLLSLGLTLAVGLLVWLAGVVGGGVTETFFSAVWTLAYRDLVGMGRTGKAALTARDFEANQVPKSRSGPNRIAELKARHSPGVDTEHASLGVCQWAQSALELLRMPRVSRLCAGVRMTV
jgi:hypothetical protein